MLKGATWPMTISLACPKPIDMAQCDGCAEPYISFGSVQDPVLENMMSLVQSPAWQTLLPRTDNNQCNRIHFSLAAVHCFDNGYVREQPVAWKEYCAK